ncbi:MAG: hypothetical protein AAEJ52_14615 [Myxococcota bacterium]
MDTPSKHGASLEMRRAARVQTFRVRPALLLTGTIELVAAT